MTKLKDLIAKLNVAAQMYGDDIEVRILLCKDEDYVWHHNEDPVLTICAKTPDRYIRDEAIARHELAIRTQAGTAT